MVEHNILKYNSKNVYFQNTTISKTYVDRLFYNHHKWENRQAQWCLVDLQQLDQLVSEINCLSNSKELA